MRAAIRAKDPTRDLCTRPAADPRLVYELVPGRCGANSRGFLDREHAVPKPSGMRRVLVVGDSVAQGTGVPPERSFPRRLEALLNTRAGGPATDVVTLAMAGYSTSQELRLLETEAPRYEPDVVLWSYVLNDPADPVFHNPNGELGVYHARPGSLLLELVAGRLFLLREAWRARECRDEYHARLHCAYRPEIAASLLRIGSWSQAHRVPVIFAVHPVFEAGGGFESYSLAGVSGDLFGLARAAGLRPIDLIAAYQGREPEAVKLPDPPGWHDAWHPNEEGHRLLAEYLARVLGADDQALGAAPEAGPKDRS